MGGLHTVEYVPTWKTRKGGHLRFKVFCRLCSLAVVVTVADALLFIALSAHGLPSQLDISFEEGGCR